MHQLNTHRYQTTYDNTHRSYILRWFEDILVNGIQCDVTFILLYNV